MMYNYALFFHIVGALLLFAGLGIELTSLLNIKEANRHILIPKILKMNRVYGIAMILILLTGIEMMSEVWGFNSWIIMAFIGIIINSILFTNVTGKRLKNFIKTSVKGSDNMQSENKMMVNDPILWLSVNVRISVIIGIIFLMTIKPGMLWSLVTIILSAAAGLLITAFNNKLKKSRNIGLTANS